MGRSAVAGWGNSAAGGAAAGGSGAEHTDGTRWRPWSAAAGTDGVRRTYNISVSRSTGEAVRNHGVVGAWILLSLARRYRASNGLQKHRQLRCLVVERLAQLLREHVDLHAAQLRVVAAREQRYQVRALNVLCSGARVECEPQRRC